ncbi:MAG: glycosyltransferase [Dermatophilaceae bacterium]
MYYAWDDWLEYPPLRQAREVYAWSYGQIARGGVKVVAVSQGVIDNIQPSRWAVVPNGVDPKSFQGLPRPPAWFFGLRRPIALYAGALEQRVDVELLARVARELKDWTFVLVGPMGLPEAFGALSGEPNVHINEAVPRREVLAMAAAANVCLIPHRETPMSKSMSPLKLYEYLGAGSPVVATDLEPMRGVSERCLLVPASGSFSAAILEAGELPPQTEESRQDFLKAHSWENRYTQWRAAVLSA